MNQEQGPGTRTRDTNQDEPETTTFKDGPGVDCGGGRC